LSKPIWLSLVETVDTFADRMGIAHESDERGANPDARTELLARLAGEALTAEGLAVEREPPEYERISAAWWAMAIPEGIGYAERGRATFDQIGVTVVNFRQSAICRVIAPGTIAGYRSVRVSAEAVEKHWRPEGADSVSAPASATKRKNPGGAHRVHDWDRFWIEIVRIANTPDGLPDRHTLRKLMVKFVSQQWERQPDDSQIRDRLRWLDEALDR
jgi:hypothetical protein